MSSKHTTSVPPAPAHTRGGTGASGQAPAARTPSPGKPGASAPAKNDRATQTDPSRYVTLYEAFFHALPEFHPVSGWTPNASTHYSSWKTESTTPPTYWEEVPVEHYLGKAEKMVHRTGVKQYLLTHMDPTMDPLMRMLYEADVVRYGNEQLVFHVNHALFAGIATRIESLTEVELDGCRPDQIWRKASTLDAKEAFALFEVKIKGTIIPGEFEKARLKEGETPEAKIKSATGKFGTTHFAEKSERIMSQAARYAQNTFFNTNYVALFDGDYLFLCVFNRAPSYSVKGTLVSCRGSGGKDKNARMALLGWLIEAWEEDLAGRNSHVPLHPGRPTKTTRSTSTAAGLLAEERIAPSGGGGGSSTTSTPSASFDLGAPQGSAKGSAARVAPPRSSSPAVSAAPAAAASRGSRPAGPSAPAAARTTRSATATATASRRNAAGPATLPVRQRKQKIDRATGKPMVGKDGKPIYED